MLGPPPPPWFARMFESASPVPPCPLPALLALFLLNRTNKPGKVVGNLGGGPNGVGEGPPASPSSAPVLPEAPGGHPRAGKGGSATASRPPARYLVAVTTCNHWRMTEAALGNLASITDSIDLVVVDDNSEDDTVQQALALGVRVVEVRGAPGWWYRGCNKVPPIPSATTCDGWGAYLFLHAPVRVAPMMGGRRLRVKLCGSAWLASRRWRSQKG